MTIIIDANIILSGIINPYGIIASLLIMEHPGIDFVTPEFAITEIQFHKKRICTKQKIAPVEFDILLNKFLANITPFGHDAVTEDIYRKAEEITSSIDTNDTWYIAFALTLDGVLWTGDLKLHYALRKKQFYKSIITAEFNSILKGL